MKKHLTQEQAASLATAVLIVDALYPHRYLGIAKYAPQPADKHSDKKPRP